MFKNAEAAATKLNHLFGNDRLNPQTTRAIDGDTKNLACKLYTHWMQGIMDYDEEKLKNVRINMARYFDQRLLPSPEFKVRDLVRVNVRNLKS